MMSGDRRQEKSPQAGCSRYDCRTLLGIDHLVHDAERIPKMVDARNLMSELAQSGIAIWVEEGRLRYKAPQGALTAHLRQRLTDNRNELLALLAAQRDLVTETRLPPISPRPPEQRSALSYSQQRLWFLDQLLPGRATYNMPFVHRLQGPLQVEALRQALCDVIRRHEILRTEIVSVDGVAQARVATGVTTALPLTDLTGITGAQRTLEAERLASIEARQPFDLSRAPLLRAQLLRLAADEHWFLLCLHHSVSDDWSMDVLWRELAVCYPARCLGTEPALPELTVQYADFAGWQHDQVNTGRLQGQLEYWKRHLHGTRSTLDLPTDRRRPSQKDYRGDVRDLRVPSHVVNALKQLARRHNATLYMVVAAALKTLLHRYGGQDSIILGTAIAGRRQAEVEPLIGFFVNTLVLKTDVSGDPAFSELVERVRKVALAAYAHQDVPFECVIEALQPERDMGRTPLFDVLLVMHTSHEVRRLSGLQIDRLPISTGTAKFDLTLEVTETVDGFLSGFFEYDTDLFERETIDRLTGHFETLLGGIAAAPETRLSELPLLTEAERQRLLVDWNNTRRDYPREALTQDAFQAQAARTPERVAVTCAATTVSYGELDARATRLAHVLRSRGAGRGQRIGLCVERGVDMLAAVLGILESGAAYVPLDPSFPVERLRFMVEDAQLTLLVSTTALAATLGVPRERQLLLDADAEVITSAPITRLPVDERRAQPDDPAYVIYTSGSTGRPKGVVVPHRAVVNFLSSMARQPGLTNADVLVAVTTLSFDIAVLELQLPLTVGATVVIASREESVDGDALRGLLAKHGATLMQATPVTWRLLLDAGWRGEERFKALVGGEALPADLADQLVGTGVEVWNMYGPTETTVWSTCARIADTSKGITIGTPIGNTTIYILDTRTQPCPIGVAGELYIGGEGVTRGYWNRPELTAERFIPDPFAATPDARLYRTGDRARWRSDGALEHLGRLDFQVKVRGYRIELEEIEAVLAEHPDVRQAAVHLCAITRDDVRIVACCVPAKAGALSPVSLRKHLRVRLPEYMIPQYFLAIDAIPLTPNGKVDRSRLPTPAVIESPTLRYEAPADSAEQAIVDIWTGLLQPANPIGRHDRFFEVGGHSLLALRALLQMERRLGVKFDLRVLILEHVADIAVRCRSVSTGQRHA